MLSNNHIDKLSLMILYTLSSIVMLRFFLASMIFFYYNLQTSINKI